MVKDLKGNYNPFYFLALFIIIILAGIIHGMFLSGGSLLVIYALTALKKIRVQSNIDCGLGYTEFRINY